MLADAPQYHYENTDSKPKSLAQAKKLTNANAKEMMEYFKSIGGEVG